MKSVFEYTNYRLYLKDFYEEKKTTSGFTYRDFSEMTGMNSTSWLLHLIKGTKNLSANTARRISKALKLGSRESEHFRLMVDFTQAKSSEVKDQAFQAMLTLKRKLNIAQIGDEHYEYYTKWYHPVVRSLVTKIDFAQGRKEPDYGLLARSLMPTISIEDAKKSVRLLEKLGFISRGEDGRYVQSQVAISTGDEVASLNVINYHKQVSRLAETAHDRAPREERDISALTLGLGEAEFSAIKARIQTFRKEIMDMALASKQADRVYQLNFQFFPVGRGKT
jgi:uncharacterized protein (TIGR02147 family)